MYCIWDISSTWTRRSPRPSGRRQGILPSMWRLRVEVVEFLPQPPHPRPIMSPSQEWTNRYGALIRFFEEHGHTDIPVDHGLREWATYQLEHRGELSEQQVEQLCLVNFAFADLGKPPKVIGRCSNQTCAKHAAFNKQCHAYYLSSMAAEKMDSRC